MSFSNATRSVPFFNYPSIFNDEEAQWVAIFTDVGRRGAFIQQKDLVEFEERIARYVGAKHVLGMANATDALHLALRAAGIGPGDEVIFCSHTMVATAASVAYAGGTPVPVETGWDHVMDPDAIEAAITPRTKAIMPTQLNGRTADMDAIRAIADKHGLMVFEDAAQALGSRFNGKHAGTFGVAACISFYPAKTLGCFGDGGCVITNDDEIFRKIKALRDHGRDDTGEVIAWGLNSRLDNLQAAILNHKLDTYDQAIMRRRAIASIYQRELGSLPQLKLPPAPDSDPRHFDIYQNYEIEAEQRDDLRENLKSRGIGTILQWGGKAVHQFKGLGFTCSLPYTEQMFQRLLMLPMNTSMSDEDALYICDSVRDFYAAADSSQLRVA